MQRHKKSFLWNMVRLTVMLAFVLSVLPVASPASVVQAATTNTLKLRVVSARTEPRAFDGVGVAKGDAVTQYKFIINVDDTGDPAQSRDPGCSPTDPDYPANCNWPSLHTIQGSSPILTQGDSSLLNENTGLDLPSGKYLISVEANGYRIDGAHFTVPLEDPGVVEVGMQPLPLPPATIRVRVFEDNAPTNGAPDEPGENGLAGFLAIVNDVLGQVSTDVFGNPICTLYQLDAQGNAVLDADGTPIIAQVGGECLSDDNGDIVIPNMGPNRYAVSVMPPDGTDWIQTTTLEGNLDWDSWVMEGYSGFDNEFIVGSEPFPFTIFGFVQPHSFSDTSVTGEIKGVVANAAVYVPYQGGLPYNGDLWGGYAGAKLTEVIPSPFVALSDLGNGDQTVYVGRGNEDGTFDIKNVPDGDYSMAVWDDELSHLLDFITVSVQNGEVVDTGVTFLTGWFTKVEGTVFNDLNGNGIQDPGEPGVPNFPIGVKRRENSSMDRGSTGAVTDSNGRYMLDNLYPLTSWLVVEAYSDLYYTTGITYQTDNQTAPTTILGAGVDVNVLPIIGQSGRLDWGVKPYNETENGGIVGTVSYDTTRNELDPAYAGIETYQPGIPGLTVNLYAAVKDSNGNFVKEADGSYKKGALLNTYITETWEQPKDCVVRDVNGDEVHHAVLPPFTGGHNCLEAPLMGLQVDHGFATVDGNYGFGTIWQTDSNGNYVLDGSGNKIEDPIPAGDYLVDVVIPNDQYGHPLYKVTKEEDINVFKGDSFIPRIPPPVCAGPLHTVDVKGVGPDGPDAVDNPDFAAAGGSIYEGEQKPLCNTKLVQLQNGKSIAPTFTFFTDVPIPGKFSGYIIDDLNISTNPQDLLFGEKAGVPNSPIGLYDFTDRLVETIQSDPNGLFEVLLPSSSTYNCPTPAGVCPGMYRLVGNDPGQPGAPNPNYNPQFRTISAMFEVWPGDIIPADLAPTQIGVSIQAPGSQFDGATVCKLDDATPQFFAVSKPYGASNESINIFGLHFGATRGTGTVLLDNLSLQVTSWTDRQITVRIPSSATPGPHQLMVKANNSQTLVNGVTFHVIGRNYRPTIFEVKPGVLNPGNRIFDNIQAAVNAASANSIRNPLVVVYPGSPTSFNPMGIWYENVVMYKPIKLQGVGPGGVYSDSTFVSGSIIDGSGFAGDTQAATDWRGLVNSLQWDGNQQPYEGEVILVVAKNGDFTGSFAASVDGFTIQGGNQQGVNQIGGPEGNPAAEGTGVPISQGGGIFVNAYGRNLRITNNVFASNGGSYGGAIRLGTPMIGSNHNENMVINHNMIIANGGSNLAGAIGVFAGSNNYEIAYNDICGNFSAEYGGGISHYGYSPNGQIHNNRIYFNRSYDEGGGVFVAGELPANPGVLSDGSGPVDIYNNIVQANLANDDGGGLRFLMVENFPINVYNNVVANNVSTHEGAGIALDDAPNLRIYNNTVMKNITTATAFTSNGMPAPTGLSTVANSQQLQAILPSGSPTFSKPVLFNNIFWDNRAGSWDRFQGGCVLGIGLPCDPNLTTINYWDMGVSGGAGTLEPTNSLFQVQTATVANDGSNLIGVDPQVVATFDSAVSVLPWRGDPHMVGINIVAVTLPPTLMGDYHLQSTSPAIDFGAASSNGRAAPSTDLDGDLRPASGGYDAGADEIGAFSNIQAVIPGSPALLANFFLPLQSLFLPLLGR